MNVREKFVRQLKETLKIYTKGVDGTRGFFNRAAAAPAGAGAAGIHNRLADAQRGLCLRQHLVEAIEAVVVTRLVQLLEISLCFL